MVAHRMRTLVLKGKYTDRTHRTRRGFCEVYEREGRKQRVLVEIWDYFDGRSVVSIHAR